MTKLGVIGFGALGSFYSRLIATDHRVDGLTIGAICDIDPARRELARELYPDIPVFEDMDEAAGLLCDSEGEDQSCDVLDMEFPIRDYLVPMLIELVVKELSGSYLRRADEANNAKDDLPEVNRRA